MVQSIPTQHPAEMALVSTVSDNMQRFTKREPRHEGFLRGWDILRPR